MKQKNTNHVEGHDLMEIKPIHLMHLHDGSLHRLLGLRMRTAISYLSTEAMQNLVIIMKILM